MWGGERLMPKNQVYCAEKLRKTLLFDGDRQIGARIENLVAGTSFPIPADKTVIEWSESPRGRKRVFDCSLARVTGVDGGGYSLADDGGLFSVRIDFSAGADGTLLKTVSLSASRDVFLRSVTADAFPVQEGFSRQTPLAPRTLIPPVIARLGQPVYVADIFTGLESPAGDNFIADGEARAVYHTGRRFSEVATNGVYTLPSVVLGAAKGADLDSVQNAFFSYIEAIARPARFRLQFNSWYDNMLDIDPCRIEKSFTEVAEGAARAGLRPLDCYVVDDGWTDYTHPRFWEFNDKFKDGFAREAALTARLGSTFGVWFGPRGGYTKQTVKYARLLKKLGYHMNAASFDICTGDPRYIADLTDRMCEFARRYNVSYFKIDGFAKLPCRACGHGHPAARGKGLAFYTFLWEEWLKGLEKVSAARPGVVLNITSYAHCSPWFLKWADFVWMNNASDMGYSGSGDDLAMCLSYRDARYRDLFIVQGMQFPAAHLYNHEPCYALKNRNLTRKDPAPVRFTDEQFETYLKCCMMRGSGLAELYFSPAMMDENKWKIAAKVLSFAERNFRVLSASRFFGGDPEKGEVYGYYAERDGSYALMLRNSGASPAKCSFTFPAAGRIDAELAPYEIRFFTDLT